MMKRAINAIKKYLASHTPYITIWTVVQDCKTNVEIERLMFLHYTSARKAFDELNDQANKDAKKYALDGCNIILGGEPLFLV